MKIPKYKIFLAIADYILLNLAFAIALRLRFRPYIDIIDVKGKFVITEILIFALISFLGIYIFEKNQLYRYQVISNRKVHFSKLFRSIAIDLLAIMLIATYLFKLGSRFESRLVLIYFIVGSMLLFFIYRVVFFKYLFTWMQKRGYYHRRLVIYGAGRTGQRVRKLIEKGSRWSFIGFIDEHKPVDESKKILGNLDALVNLRQKNKVNTVIIAMAHPDQKELQDIIDALKLFELRIFLVSDTFNIVYETQPLEVFDNLPLIEVNYNSQSFNLVVIKRIVDIVGSVILSIVLLPLFLAIIIAIKVTSKGPAVFKQRRIGINGKEFTFYKFRSMYIDNIPDSHEKFVKDYIKGQSKSETLKITDDPRVTPIGKIIRKTSLDELPQLLNVVKGEMSLVGPRPCLPYEYEEYKEWHKARFLIKPGCTGVWQVSGRSKVSFDDMIMMDYYYLHNMSPWMDFKLILKTIPVMLFGKGGF